MAEAQQHKEIQKGFNAGYLLEKLNPQLAVKLRNGVSDKSSPFMLGMLKGAEQYRDESFFDSPAPNMPDNIEDLDLDNPDIGFQKGRDDVDMDIER